MTHTNTELTNIIKRHFAKDGKRLTNISKANKDKLKGIIEKYNIPLPEPEKKERKKPAKKEQLDTTMHPFRLGKFEYTYEYDDYQGYYGCNNTPFRYEITKITKCYITIEYVDYNGFNTEQPCRIKFAENRGWYFEKGTLQDKEEIFMDKYTETIEEKEERLEFERAIWKCGCVWNKYH